MASAYLSQERILRLGEQLVAQPTLSAQVALIVDTATQLVQSEANLWLAETVYPSVVLQEPPVSPTAPLTDLMRRALEARQAVRSSQREPVCHEGSESAGDGTAVALPLLSHETVLGVLEVRRPDGPPFCENEMELLNGLAIQSSIALQAARQAAVERWQAEQLSLVRRVSAQVADVFDLDELAQRVTRLILQTFGYYFVALFTLEPSQGTLNCRASASRDESPLDGGKQAPVVQVPLGDGIIGSAAQTGTEIVANDVSHESRYRYVDALPATRSEVALPLIIETRVLGVLDVQSDHADAFDENTVLVLRVLADSIAMAVEHSRLYSDLRRRADQLSAVAVVGRAVASILDIDVLFEEVVRLIQRQFGYSHVYLFTVDPARNQVVCRAGIDTSCDPLETVECTLDRDDSQGIVPWVICHGETVICNDTNVDSRCRPSHLPPVDTRAELAVPLIYGERVLGALNVRSDRPGTFGDEDQFLFEALADSIATAIRNANLYRSEQWRRQVADSLREVAGLLSSSRALDDVLEAILVELERTLPCDVASVWLLQNGSLCLSAVRGLGADVPVDTLSADADSWLGQALGVDQPIVRTAESPGEPTGAALGFPPDYSAIAAPLRVGDRPLGVLALAHRASERYGSESRTITAAFASYAAVAIENARLYQEAQELARISTVMLQVAEATRSLTTLDQVLETVAHLVPTLVGVDRCAIFLWDDGVGMFVPAAASGLTESQQDTFEQWIVAPGEEPAFDDLRRKQMPIFVYDVMTDSRLSTLVVWDLGFESLLLLPLLGQDQVLGAMLIDYQTDWSELDAIGVRTIRDERLVIIQGIALQTAAAIENTRLREAQREEAYVSAALLQVAQAVANLNDLDDILSTVARIMPILVGVEWCVIFLWDDAESIFRPAQAFGIPREAQASLLAQQYAPDSFGLLDTVRGCDCHVVYPSDPSLETVGQRSAGYEEGPADELIQVPLDFRAFLPQDTRSSERQTSSHPLLAVPLSVKGDVLGVMLLEEVSTSRRFRQGTKARWMEIITGIAHQAALAVQSDRLQQEMTERERLERELQLAHEIQQTFMPSRWLDFSGWDLAFTWRAARQVAGDFYDFFELPGGRLGLVIADVADKGMPAALFMALTRTLMRAAALEEASPAAAVGRVNDLLVPDAQSGMFVTALYAVVSLETGELTYANAGHNLPLLWRSRTGELEQLEKGGIALGVVDGARVDEHVVSLEPGDSLVFYTDGITEAFSAQDEIYGEERLRAIIQAVRDGSAQEIMDAIDGSVEDFVAGAAPSDDRTIMVLRRLLTRQ
jgi:sigma-B regulation protein RsbU (phosphoserine phosphatase)